MIGEKDKRRPLVKWTALAKVASLELKYLSIVAAAAAPVSAGAIYLFNDFAAAEQIPFQISIPLSLFVTFLLGILYYTAVAIIRIFCPPLLLEFKDLRSYTVFVADSTSRLSSVFNPDTEIASDDATEKYAVFIEYARSLLENAEADWIDLECSNHLAKYLATFLLVLSILLLIYLISLLEVIRFLGGPPVLSA